MHEDSIAIRTKLKSKARDGLHNIARLRNAGHSKFASIDNGRIRDWTIRQIYILGKVADAELEGEIGIEITTNLKDIAKRLIQRGLVKRVPGENNIEFISLSERGRQTLAEGVEFMEAVHNELLAPLTLAQRYEFLSMLDVVSNALDDCEPTQDLSPKRRGRPRSYPRL